LKPQKTTLIDPLLIHFSLSGSHRIRFRCDFSFKPTPKICGFSPSYYPEADSRNDNYELKVSREEKIIGLGNAPSERDRRNPFFTIVKEWH
jgi:hypothetical protein